MHVLTYVKNKTYAYIFKIHFLTMICIIYSNPWNRYNILKPREKFNFQKIDRVF